MLKVWIPGTTDFRDQGLNNSAITNTNVTIDANGKIGSCLKFNNTGNLIGRPGVLTNDTNDWTYACWMKVNTVHNGCLFSDRTATNYTGITIFYYSSQWIIDDGVRWQFTPTTTIATNTWYHICVVRKKGVGKYLYINGQLDSSIETTGTPSIVSTEAFAIGSSQSSSTTVTGNQFNGYLNDIRIYDHALSPKEIAEIAKGLVVHYTLSGFGQDNLLPNSYSEKTVTNSAARFFIPQAIATQISEQVVTISVDIKASIDHVRGDLYFGGVSSGVYEPSPYYPYVTTEYKRYSVTLTAPELTSDCAIVFRNNNNSGSNTSATYYYRNPKIEFGNEATLWIPNSTDELYSAMGLDDGIEYDISGYGNDGNINGTITYSSDTPRYITSEIFNGSSTYIEANSLPTETKTVSIWMKTTWSSASGYQLAVHDKGIGLAIGFSDTRIITYVGTSNGSTGSAVQTSGKYLADQWNHIVVIKTGDKTREVYVNGEKMSTASNNYWGGDLNKLLIGNRHISGKYNHYFKGNLSDFRAYVTALTEDQIVELYQTGQSLSNNGTLFGYEFVEGGGG